MQGEHVPSYVVCHPTGLSIIVFPCSRPTCIMSWSYKCPYLIPAPVRTRDHAIELVGFYRRNNVPPSLVCVPSDMTPPESCPSLRGMVRLRAEDQQMLKEEKIPPQLMLNFDQYWEVKSRNPKRKHWKSRAAVGKYKQPLMTRKQKRVVKANSQSNPWDFHAGPCAD